MPQGLRVRTGTPQPPTKHNVRQQSAAKSAHLGQRAAFVTVTGICCLEWATSGSLRAFPSSTLQKCEQRNTNHHMPHLRLCKGSKGTHRTDTKLMTEHQTGIHQTKPVPRHTKLVTETPLQPVLRMWFSAEHGRHVTGEPHPPTKAQEWTESFDFLPSSLQMMSLSDRTYSG